MAVVVHRHPAGEGHRALTLVRRRSQLDHPALAPVVDTWLDGDELVVVQAATPGRTVCHRMAEIAEWPRARRVGEVLAPLAVALDLMHGHGLAQGVLTADTVVLSRLEGARVLPVLVGAPAPDATADDDRRGLVLLGRLLGFTGDAPTRSCGAWVDGLAAEGSAPPPRPRAGGFIGRARAWRASQ